MNRDYDDDGQLIRMCTPCMEGTLDMNDFIYDPHLVKLNVSTVAVITLLRRSSSETGLSETSAEQHLGGYNERQNYY